ncbi:MAG: OmpH family outer membrane protein [Candidatus Nitrospinota bacterium M3_3B_026]
MRRITRIPLTLALAAMLALTAFPGPSRAADAPKIGGVNLQDILDGSKAGQEALAELKEQAEKERKALQNKQEAVQKLKKEIDQQRLMLSTAAIMEKERRLRRMQRELELYRDDIQELLQTAQARVMRKLLDDVMTIIKEYGEKHGYTMILEKGEAANVMGGFVLYMDEAVDLTPEIIRIYDEKKKSGALKSGG